MEAYGGLKAAHEQRHSDEYDAPGGDGTCPPGTPLYTADMEWVQQMLYLGYRLDRGLKANKNERGITNINGRNEKFGQESIGKVLRAADGGRRRCRVVEWRAS